MTDIQFRFNEDKSLEEITSYIKTTYTAHYAAGGGHQLFDDLVAENEAKEFFKWNARKYLTRFGKKEGENRKDIIKALHYTILLLGVLDQKK